MPRRRSKRRRLAALLDLARHRAPEQVQDLRDDDHRGDPVVAQGIEDDARVAAADVQDVGADARARRTARPPARGGATAGAARRSGVPACGMTAWNDSIEARMLSWASITPFGTPVVPDVNTSWKMSSGAGGSQAAWVASQSGGKAGSSGSARRRAPRASSSGIARGRASRGSGASRPVPRMRWRVSARAHDALDRLDRHPQVQRHDRSAARAWRRSRPPASSGIDGDQVRIRSPGSRPSARSRQAAIRLRRSSSRNDQMLVDPSSARRLSAGLSP